MSENNEILLAGKKGGRNVQEVSSLRTPDIDLLFSASADGKGLGITLNLPRTSGDTSGLPFIALMQDDEINRSLKSKIGESAINKLREIAPAVEFGPINVGTNITAGGGAPAGAIKNFEIGLNLGTTINVNQKPKFDGVMRELQEEFDTLRGDAYIGRAKKWAIEGGAVVPAVKDANGKPLGPDVRVSDIDAANYILSQGLKVNKADRDAVHSTVIRRHDAAGDQSDEYKNYLKQFNPEYLKSLRADATVAPGKSGSASDEPAAVQRTAALPLDQQTHPMNRQFEQALKGSNGDRDAAALAVDTISRTQGYRPDQDISVVQGKNGNFIVSQGQGDAALNLAVPQAKQGDLERVSSQLAQAPQPQPSAQPLDQPERTRAPVV
jgi:hypothetical protein